MKNSKLRDSKIRWATELLIRGLRPAMPAGLAILLILAAEPKVAHAVGKTVGTSVSLVSAEAPHFAVRIKTYDLANAQSLSYFQEQAALILAVSQDPRTPSPHQALATSDGKRMALQASLIWANQLAQSGLSESLRAKLIRQIQEAVVSFDSNFLSPEPLSGDVVNIGTYLDRPIAVGTRIATNLDMSTSSSLGVIPKNSFDLGRLDPVPSTFWTPPASIRSLDLYNGYGRVSRTTTPNQVCKYTDKKGGYGTNGGFTIKCGDSKYKAKWGSETRVEPFNSRIVRALGYDTKTSDRWPYVWVQYDRHIFTEYNVRDELSVRISLLAVPLGHLRIFRHLDPFATIAKVRLKNGSFVNGEEFKRRLLISVKDGDEAKDSNYQLGFENQVDIICFRELSVQIPDKGFENIGGWGWEDLGYYQGNQKIVGSSLGHEDRRELRGFGVLAAWLGMYDIRWDNNKLRIRRGKDGNYELRHAITDLGSGLGSSSSVIKFKNSDVNAFPWVFTKSRACPAGSDCVPDKFEITDYITADHNQTFANITTDDARWMAKWIAQLTHEQIVSALAASGFNQAEIYLYARKLEVRRDQLLRDLGLSRYSAQFAPLLNSNNVGQPLGQENRDFTLHPFLVHLASGRQFDAPIEGCRLERGQMKCDPH